MSEKLYWRQPISQGVWDFLKELERLHTEGDKTCADRTTIRKFLITEAVAAVSLVEDIDNSVRSPETGQKL